MSRIKTPKIKFTYVDAPDSEERLQRAYNRIFAIARRNIVEKATQWKTTSQKQR